MFCVTRFSRLVLSLFLRIQCPDDKSKVAAAEGRGSRLLSPAEAPVANVARGVH